MAALSGTLAFVLGVFVGLRLLAALYSVIDLWYAIRTAWPTVLVRVLVWSGITAGVLWLLGARARAPFLAGMAFYLLVFVGTNLGIIVSGALRTKPTPTVE